MIIHTSTCSVRTIDWFNDLTSNRTGALYYSGHFSPLSQEQPTRVHNFLQRASDEHHSYASHCFRISAVTSVAATSAAAAAGLPTWLIKAMG